MSDDRHSPRVCFVLSTQTMQGTLRNYVDVMKDVGPFLTVVSTYPTTSSLNLFLYGASGFSFPAVTNRTLEDVISYHLSIVGESYADDVGDLDVGGEQLGRYIEEDYYPIYTPYISLLRRLLDYRERKIGKYTSEFEWASYLIKLVYERNGPWDLCNYFWYPVDAVHSADEMYRLFVDLGISDGLVYSRSISLPNRAELIESFTYAAASNPSTYKWLIDSTDSSECYVELNDLFTIIPFAKVFQLSSSTADFKKRFMALSEVLFDLTMSHRTGKNLIFELFKFVRSLLIAPHLSDEVDGIKIIKYIHYMVKALAYAELVFEIKVTDCIDLGPSSYGNNNYEVLKMLADSRM